MEVRHIRRNAGRTVAMAAVLLLAAVLIPTRAQAASIAKASASGGGSVTSGSWLATVSPTVLTFTTNTAQTTTVTNTGTIALVAISYQVTISNPASGSPIFTLFACAVAWSGGKCSGGAGTKVGTTYAKNSTILISSTVIPAIGGSVYLQATPTSLTSSTTMTLGTSISSATQLRAAVKSNQ